VLLMLTTGAEYTALRSARAPQTVMAFSIHPQTKGAVPSESLRLPASGEFIELELDLLDVSPHYDWALERIGPNSESRAMLRGNAQPPSGEAVLKLLMPIRSLQTGQYRLILRSETGQQFTYPFEIK